MFFIVVSIFVLKVWKTFAFWHFWGFSFLLLSNKSRLWLQCLFHACTWLTIRREGVAQIFALSKREGVGGPCWNKFLGFFITFLLKSLSKISRGGGCPMSSSLPPLPRVHLWSVSLARFRFMCTPLKRGKNQRNELITDWITTELRGYWNINDLATFIGLFIWVSF
jgi:hypothetical protein